MIIILKETRKRKEIGKAQKITTKNRPRQLSRHSSKRSAKMTIMHQHLQVQRSEVYQVHQSHNQRE